jgi:hypothetical protein
MRNGTLYLNNSGHKWVNLTNGKKDKIVLKTRSGKLITRTVIYYESFGNFATCRISYKGKKISVFLDTLLED